MAMRTAIHSLARVHKEIEDVNADFHSLRTVLKETENQFEWNFVMFPNDGALSHLPLIGEIIIPDEYPERPPVLHLFTPTSRYNVDVFRGNLRSSQHSTMCFDILRSKKAGGTWEAEYTISCLFASLMQALVSQRVPQTYGPDKPEFVTMERLAKIKREVQDVYRSHKDLFPSLPPIPTIKATPITAKRFLFTRPGESSGLDTLDFTQQHVYVSQRIHLQDRKKIRTWSTVLDLRNLHAGVVFSVILSNKPGTDSIGKDKDTILIRNGVTGTAAKKKENEPISWFYHGKPLNDQNLSVCITVTNDQFTMAYKDNDTNEFLVHGDTPISKLGEAQIGKVYRKPFYLIIVLKKRSGDNGFISVLDQKGLGFIHTPQNQIAEHATTDRPTSVKLVLGIEQTARLQGIIDFYALGMDFKIQRGVAFPAQCTLINSFDYNNEEFMKMINEVYTPMRDKVNELNVTAIIADGDCVAILTDTQQSSDEGEADSVLSDKMTPIIMRLRDDSVKRTCADDLSRRIVEDTQKDWVHVGDAYVQLPQPIKVECRLKIER
ncbi:hypothetical protein PENSTE_c026G10238 [Penicillium steckii]|uniref:UBC core domain-containing protein n=1 Tax=Penicillium steckii TaxID=303698 RepID=A0A1V6SQP6_9EURO|nr:hypothetical protein PENSTE_c026G10238 [Penicillium steckii]